MDGKNLSCLTVDGEIKIELNEKDYGNVNFRVGDIILYRKLKNSNEIYQIPKVTGGAVVMDVENGDIIGMTGGFSFDISPFNCITQAKRQPAETDKQINGFSMGSYCSIWKRLQKYTKSIDGHTRPNFLTY